jgi:hypothetical protein
MRIHYNKAIGIGSIILGVGLMCLALLTGGDGGATFPFVIGGFEILYGILTLMKPYVFVDDSVLEVYALAGNAVAKYKFQSLKEIEIQNNRLFIDQNGKRQKIKIVAWMTDRGDWQKLLQKIKNAA